MPLLLAAACGLLLTLALPPLGWWPFAFALAPVFALVARAKDGRAAFRVGAAFGLPFFALYILWLPRSFAVLFGPAFWFVYPFLLAILAVFWGLTAWGTWRVAGLAGGGSSPRGRAKRVLLLLPVAWVFVEWARTQGYFAFPWGTLGYAWLETPVAQLAEFGGVYGLSLLVTAPAALLAWPWAVGARPGRGGSGQARGATVACCVVAVALVGAAFMVGSAVQRGAPTLAAEAASAPYRALLVQGNVDPFARAASSAQELGVHLRLTEGGDTASSPFDLVVWPEGAVIGYDLTAGDAGTLRSAITASAPGATFVVGGRVYDGDGSYNSLIALRADAELGHYDKHYLVPFGERWPLIETLSGLYAAVFRAFGLPMLAGTTPGEVIEPIASPLGSLGAFVCYESVFPQVQRLLVERGAGVLVLGTNDAWFGVGTGARQHFDMGRLRAIETRRWLLRAGNDGVTAAVDPWGRVTAEVERGVATTLTVSFDTRDDLTLWTRHGAWTPVALLAWAALVAAVGLISAGRSGSPVDPAGQA